MILKLLHGTIILYMKLIGNTEFGELWNIFCYYQSDGIVSTNFPSFTSKSDIHHMLISVLIHHLKIYILR